MQICIETKPVPSKFSPTERLIWNILWNSYNEQCSLPTTKQVRQLWAETNQSPEILHRADSAIRAHILNLKSKLGCHSRMGIILRAEARATPRTLSSWPIMVPAAALTHLEKRIIGLFKEEMEARREVPSNLVLADILNCKEGTVKVTLSKMSKKIGGVKREQWWLIELV